MTNRNTLKAECSRCGRDTDFLFSVDRRVTVIVKWLKNGYPYKPRYPVFHQFVKVDLVCQRCRPMSNWETEEKRKA